MRRKDQDRVVKVFGFVLLVTIVLAGFGSAVWQLWNWLMPPIFALGRIGYWQAVGLMLLSWILFGGLRGFGMLDPSGSRHARLTPEDRERLRRGFDRLAGPSAPAP